ncbi:hypothetical protein CT0861_05793 [Colletotrichum tofieldiae]|uniref:Uncharacterized protein n=1 Tax=Colletotrichum tofieldiae TaxID=708197 RepID=A0A166W8X9_9PEZI|nr:hypothetical protein CT0861_05793 [Colletotrichum tofieldiae]
MNTLARGQTHGDRLVKICTARQGVSTGVDGSFLLGLLTQRALAIFGDLVSILDSSSPLVGNASDQTSLGTRLGSGYTGLIG